MKIEIKLENSVYLEEKSSVTTKFITCIVTLLKNWIFSKSLIVHLFTHRITSFNFTNKTEFFSYY